MIFRTVAIFILSTLLCIYSSTTVIPPTPPCGENSIFNPQTQECECIDCYTKDEFGECTLCTSACESMYYAGKQLCVSKVPQTATLDNVDNYGSKPFEIKNEMYSDVKKHGSSLEDIEMSNKIAELNFNKVSPYFKNDTGEVYRLNRSLLPKHSKDYTNDWMPTPEDTTGITVNNYYGAANLAKNSMGLNYNQDVRQLTEFANGDIMDEYQPITGLHRPYIKKPLELWGTRYEKENTRVLNGRNEVPGPYATPIIEADSKLEFRQPIIAGSTIPEPNNNRNNFEARQSLNNELREHAQTYMGHAYIETGGDDILRQSESNEVRDRIIPSLLGVREAGHIIDPYIKNQDFRNIENTNMRPKQDLPDVRYPLINANNEAKPYNALREPRNYTTIRNRDFSNTQQIYSDNQGGLLQSYDNNQALREPLNSSTSDKLVYSTYNFDASLSREYYPETNNNLKTGLPTVMAK